MSTNNPNTLAPRLPFPEHGRQVYDAEIGLNTRRQGSKRAEEGLGWEPSYSGAFLESVLKSDAATNHAVYETQRATGRGRLGAGQEIPAWNAVDGATRTGFLQGTAGSEQSVTVKPFPYSQRDGANPATITPLSALRAGESPGNTYQYAKTPKNGGRGRANAAAVFGSEDVR